MKATPPDYLTPEQIALFERLSDWIVGRRMTIPAILFLESVRPLNFIGSQVMVFFSPMVHALFDVRQYDLIQQALERRETISWFTDVLEAKEEVVISGEKARKAAEKAARKARRKSG